MNLEKLLTHEHGFQLTTAQPLMRAICRMETGEPLEELADDPVVIEAIGGPQALGHLPTKQPATTCLLAGVRTGKTQKEAAKALRATQICKLDMLKDGEIARYSILSIDVDKAGSMLEHLTGKIESSPILSQLLVRKPTGESIYIRHPSGRIVEIKVVAGKRSAGSVVSRWSIGCTLDEAARMDGNDAVVNLPDVLDALPARLLPGAQVNMISSPWAPRGPVYDLWIDRFGRPGDDLMFTVGKGPDLHPAHFTPEFCEFLRINKPRAYRTDVLALFADAESSLLSSIDVETCSRAHGQEELEPNDQPCTAAIDPANRRNAWTLIIVRPRLNGSPEVVLARQWQGSKSAPLMSSTIFEKIRPLLELYQIEDNALITDQASYDDKWELAAQAGIQLYRDPFLDTEWRAHSKRLEKLVSEHMISLPRNAALRADILGIQRKLTSRSYQIILPKTGDGRHGDYAPALCLALKHLKDPVAKVPGFDEYDPFEKRMIDNLRALQADPMRRAADQLTRTFG